MARPIPEPRYVDTCDLCGHERYELEGIPHRRVVPQQCSDGGCDVEVLPCCFAAGKAFRCDWLDCDRIICGAHAIALDGEHYCSAHSRHYPSRLDRLLEEVAS